MKIILHFILRKSTIKLCLMVLFMFVFINESFSQIFSCDEAEDSYSGSYSFTVFSATTVPSFLFGDHYDYSITANVSYSGPYGPYASGYLSNSGTTFNNSYSYRILKENVTAYDSLVYIYYDPVDSCPNYNMPCNINGHGNRLIRDCGYEVISNAYYKLQIERRTNFFGIYHSDYSTTVSGSSSDSRNFYRGNAFSGYKVYR